MNHVKTVTIGASATLCLILMSFSTIETTKPVYGINNSFGETISLQDLKKLDTLTIDTKEEDLHVISFRLVVAPKNGEAFMMSSKGNAITGSKLEKILKAAVGNRIIIEKIIAQYGNGLKTFCEPAVITIVK